MANAKLWKNQIPDRIIQQLESTIMDFPGKASKQTASKKANKNGGLKMALAVE